MGLAIEIVGLSLQKWGCAERPILMSALQLHADQCLLLVMGLQIGIVFFCNLSNIY